MILKVLNRLTWHRNYDREAVKEIRQIQNGRSLCVCLVTKPLQYMNFKAIDHKDKNCNVLFVVNSFNEAEKFTQHLRKKDLFWDCIFLFDTEFEALATVNQLKELKTYWIPWDGGVENNFLLKRLHKKGCKIKLIEEGCGNYCVSNLSFKYFKPFLAAYPIISKLTFELVRGIARYVSGCGNRMNCSKWLDEIHLYYPDYPQISCRDKRILRKLPLNPYENFVRLSVFFDLADCEWLSEIKNKKILFINTSWDGIANFTDDDLKKYDEVVVKYHPHLKDKCSRRDELCSYIAGNIPAEILIFKLLNQGCDVTLRSDFSSSMIYLLGTPVKLEYSNGIPDFMFDFWNFVEKKFTDVENTKK